MCQHVRGRCARSSERRDRQTRVALRFPGTGSSALSRLGVVTVDDRHCSRCLDLRSHEHPFVECVREEQDRERERRRGDRRTRKTKTVLEDSCQVGQPRRSVGGMSDEHGAAATRGLLPGPSVRDRWFEALGFEETWPSESVQSGSSDRCAGTLGTHGTQPCWIQDRFYTSARSQGGFEATNRWESALISRSLTPSIQVFAFAFLAFSCLLLQRLCCSFLRRQTDLERERYVPRCRNFVLRGTQNGLVSVNTARHDRQQGGSLYAKKRIEIIE